MKILKTLTVLAVLLLISLSCKSEAKKEAQNQQPKTEEQKCVDKPKPVDRIELNEQIRMNLNLDNQCDFQPMHMEIRKDTIYTIIGRFKSEKIKGTNKRKIIGLECYAYNLIKGQPRKYKVLDISEPILDGDLIKMTINLSTDEKIQVDKNLVKKPFEVTKKTVFDFVVYEDGKHYKIDKKDEGHTYFHGRICKTNITFE